MVFLFLHFSVFSHRDQKPKKLVYLKKDKNWKLLVRQTQTHAEIKIKHYLHQVFISFYNSKISSFFLFYFPWYIKSMCFWNNAIPLRIFLLQKIISHFRLFDFDFIQYKNLCEKITNVSNRRIVLKKRVFSIINYEIHKMSVTNTFRC